MKKSKFQRRRAAINRQLSMPGHLVRPLRKRTFRRELKAATRSQFGASRRQLLQEKRASMDQERKIGGWVDQYRSNIQRLGDQSQAAYADAQAQSVGQTDAANQQAEALRAKLRDEAQADAARRGVAYDPRGSYDFAGAELARTATAGAFQNLLRSQSVARGNFMADKDRIAEGEGINQRLEEAQRRRSIDADLRELAQKRGDFRTDYRRAARDTEREFFLGLREQGIGGQNPYYKFARQQMRFGAREDAKSRKFQKRLQQRGIAAKREGRAWSERQNGGGGRDWDKSDAMRARAILKSQGYKAKELRNIRAARKEAYAYLVGKRNVDPVLARKILNSFKRQGKKRRPSGRWPQG